MISRFLISCFVAVSFFLTLNDCQRTYQRSCECEKTVDGKCAYTLVLPVDTGGNSGSNCNGGCLTTSNDSTSKINNSLNSLGRSIDSIQVWTGEQAKMMVVLQNRLASLEQHQSFGTSDYLELRRNISEQASKLEKLERDLETVNETMTSFIAQVSTILISSNSSTGSGSTPSYRGNWSTPTSSFNQFNATKKASNETETTSGKSLFFVTSSNIQQRTNFSDPYNLSNYQLTTSSQAGQITSQVGDNANYIYTSKDLSNNNNDSNLVRNSTSGKEYFNPTTVSHSIYNFTLDGSNMKNATTNILREATENDSIISTGSTTTLRMSWNSTNGIASDSKTSQTSPSAIQVNYTALQNFTGNFTTYLYNNSNFGNISNNYNFTADSTSKVYQTTHSNSKVMDNAILTSGGPQHPYNDYNSTLSTETMKAQQAFPTTSASIREANMSFNETKKSETPTTDKQTTVSQQNSTTLRNLEGHQNNSNGNDSLHWTTHLSSRTTTQHYNHYNGSNQNVTTLNVASTDKWNSSEGNLSATTNLKNNDTLHSSATTGRSIFTEPLNVTNRGQFVTNGPITGELPPVWRMGNESSTAGQAPWKTNSQSDSWNNYSQTGQQNVFTTHPGNHISSPVIIGNNSSEHSKEPPNESMTTQFPNPIITSIFAGSGSLYTGVRLGSTQSTSNIPILMRRKRDLANMRSSISDIPFDIAESLISRIADLESKLKSWEERGRYLCSKKGLLLTNKKGSNVVSRITLSPGVKKDDQTPQLNGWCIGQLTNPILSIISSKLNFALSSTTFDNQIFSNCFNIWYILPSDVNFKFSFK